MESIHPTSNETNPPTPPTASPIFSGIVNFSGKSGEFFGIWKYQYTAKYYYFRNLFCISKSTHLPLFLRSYAYRRP